MRGARIAVGCVAAGLLLLAVVVARGGAAVTPAPRDPEARWEPPPRTGVGASAESAPVDLSEFTDGPDPLRAGALVAVLGLLVLGGVLYLLLRRRRRRRGWAGHAVAADLEPGDAAPDRLREAAERARTELAARTGGPPDNAVIAAWVALEAAVGTERAPHQTATEYAGTLLGDYTSDAAALDELRGLYHRARFGSAPLTEHDVDRAHHALDRLVR